MISFDQLQRIIPYGGQRIGVFLVPLNDAMDEFGINTPLRQAAFLAQIAHESGSLRYVREIASGAAYDTGRLAARLGNTPEADGDGQKYKGRGLIQITGLHNYRQCSTSLFGDQQILVDHPELLEVPENSARSAAWFWKEHGLNKWADAGDFDGVSDVINRGHKTQANGDANGYADRRAFYERAKKALSC